MSLSSFRWPDQRRRRRRQTDEYVFGRMFDVVGIADAAVFWKNNKKSTSKPNSTRVPSREAGATDNGEVQAPTQQQDFPFPLCDSPHISILVLSMCPNSLTERRVAYGPTCAGPWHAMSANGPRVADLYGDLIRRCQTRLQYRKRHSPGSAAPLSARQRAAMPHECEGKRCVRY